MARPWPLVFLRSRQAAVNGQVVTWPRTAAVTGVTCLSLARNAWMSQPCSGSDSRVSSLAEASTPYVFGMDGARVTEVRSRVRAVAIGQQAKQHTGVVASGLRDDHHSPRRSAIGCSRSPGHSTRRVKLERRFAGGAPGGRTLNQWVKSSPAQCCRRTTCTDATVQWRKWPSLHRFRR